MTNYNPQYPPPGQPGQPPYGQPPYGQPPYGQPPGYYPPPAKSTSWGWIIALVCIVPVGALLIAILLPALSSARDMANRTKCQANLRMIGQAVSIYEANYNQYPPSLAYLVTSGNLTATALVCPADGHSPPAGSTVSQLEMSMASGSCSYVYMGKGLGTRSSYGCVLAYEKSSNHTKRGMNVLMLDGSVQWIADPQARQVMRELQSGQNPPPSMSTRY